MTRTDVESALGELLLVGVPGVEATPEVESRLAAIRPSGVVFFAPNFPDAPTAARYTRAVHALLGTADLPAFVCADEEGGLVSQLSGFWEGPPSARAVAASGGPPLVRDLATRTARRLLTLGVNLNFAPVLDIHSNPANPVIGVRSYGTTASQVTACGRAAVEGMQAAGVIPVVKHFPGHGDTALDSHVALPRVDATLELLAFRELRPFEAAVQWGAPVVMTSHVLVPALDPDPKRPATLSPAILTDLLRGRMKFEGVIVTDALEMAGATSQGTYGDVAVRAIEAGCDLLLYSKLAPGPEEALTALRAALVSGRLSAERIEASLERIRSLRRGSAARPPEFTPTIERAARDLIPTSELERIVEGAARLLKQGAADSAPFSDRRARAESTRIAGADRGPPPGAQPDRERTRDRSRDVAQADRGERAPHGRGARRGLGGAGGDGPRVAQALPGDGDGGVAQSSRGRRLARSAHAPRHLRQLAGRPARAREPPLSAPAEAESPSATGRQAIGARPHRRSIRCGAPVEAAEMNRGVPASGNAPNDRGAPRRSARRIRPCLSPCARSGRCRSPRSRRSSPWRIRPLPSRPGPGTSSGSPPW